MTGNLLRRLRRLEPPREPARPPLTHDGLQAALDVYLVGAAQCVDGADVAIAFGGLGAKRLAALCDRFGVPAVAGDPYATWVALKPHLLPPEEINRQSRVGVRL